jgi:hypothetical protein
MKAVCPECNALNPIGNDFCGICGASLESAKVVRVAGEVQPMQEQRKHYWPAVVGVVLFVGLTYANAAREPLPDAIVSAAFTAGLVWLVLHWLANRKVETRD